jgi:hypothetical protein
MTDPHDAFDLDDNVTFLETTEINFNSHSPAIPISGDYGYGRRVSATNHSAAFSSSLATTPSINQAAYTSSSHPNSGSNHTNNLSLDQHLPSLHTNGTHGKSVNVSNTTAVAPPNSVNALDNASSATSAHLNLATLGSQPWVSPSVPYLHFAPRPSYEPTGELLNEQPELFQEFHIPQHVVGNKQVSQESSLSPPENPPTAPLLRKDSTIQSTQSTSSSVPKSTNASGAASQPARSALKRKAESLEEPTSERLQKDEQPPLKTRSVSFERMSARGATSPDEARATSDKPSAYRSGAAVAGQQGRRGRQSASTAATTPRPGLEPISTTASGEQRGSFRGTRHPSGHPPSILPPEKVFPIQIGSELFRLSGASISSDGTVLSEGHYVDFTDRH